MISLMWQRYTETKTVPLRNEIIEHYIPFAEKVSSFHYQKMAYHGRTISYDEVVSAAYVGLCQAVEKFNPELKIKFETYSRPRLIGAIKDWQREIDPLKRTQRKKLREQKKTLKWVQLEEEWVVDKLSYEHDFNQGSENWHHLIRNLNPEEQLILSLRYVTRLDLTEIGEIFGFSKQRLGLRHFRIISKLREELKNEKAHSYI